MNRAKPKVVPEQKPLAGELLKERPSEGQVVLSAMQALAQASGEHQGWTAPTEARPQSPV